jgi:ubiquinone/menaquinone biosynthesis C-methylase UbiE
MKPYDLDGAAWQESWDRQQEAFMPDREARFAAMLDTVAAVTYGQPRRVLDLAGGTGSISLRALRRFPDSATTLLDIDPVLLAIARASLPERATVVTADLREPGWVEALPHQDYDAVLTATALHWLSPDRLSELFKEAYAVIRPGGVFVNADHLLDDGVPVLSKRLSAWAKAHREARWVAGAALSWDGWWERVATHPGLGQLMAERAQIFPDDHREVAAPPVSWHIKTLRNAGFAEVGLVWRGGVDAAVAAVR